MWGGVGGGSVETTRNGTDRGVARRSLGQELRKLVEKVRVVFEEICHLVVHVLDADALLLLLVCVQNLQKMLVDLLLPREAALRVGDVVGLARGCGGGQGAMRSRPTLILLT